MIGRDAATPGRIRVLRVIARLNVGGPAWHVVLLSAGTQRRYPTLLAVGAVGTGERDMSSFAASRGVSLLRVPGLGREPTLLGDLRALWTLWALCRRWRPDIVHTHTAKAGALGRIAALLARVPVRVHTFHGHVFHGYFGRFRTALFLAMERLLARVTTRIIAISPRQAEDLRRYLAVEPERVRVVPLGLQLDQFVTADASAARQRFRMHVGARDETVVTMVGRLTAIKNHALALRALAQTGDRGAKLLLVFVGGGEEETALRNLARGLGLEGRVRFAGWWEDLGAVYFGSDVIALSSINEGTPVCLIEALACGRPVMATSVGGVPDVLAGGEFGLLIPPNDLQAFSDALVRVADPHERAKLAERGRAQTLARYSSARLVADIEALYDELLTSSGGKS